MLKFILLATTCLIAWNFIAADETAKSIHDFKVLDISGKEVSLSDYKGKVVMIVNVASKCGKTPQYKELVEIQNKYGEQGFVVLGFPANEFNGQEPGTNEEIKMFCESKFNVKFPMFSKIVVKGDEQIPLFKYLTTAENPDFTGEIKWNFEKFLIDSNGVLKRRFRSGVVPNEESVTAAIEALISKK